MDWDKKFEIIYEKNQKREELKNMSKEEMTEEEYTQKRKEDLEKVEEYIEKHPKINLREAVLAVLEKDDPTTNERKVEEYMEKHENCTYREAVLAVLDRTEAEPKKEK